MVDSNKIIRELANAVIELRTAQFISQGTSADLARLAAVREMDAYLRRMNFFPQTQPDALKSGDRPMRVPGGSA